ncbi:MAG TPA: RNA polymerase sigma factor [Longimicrobium sp.]|nr:RNA polymerase sigma factor [Longimicrobium sp.]
MQPDRLHRSDPLSQRAALHLVDDASPPCADEAGSGPADERLMAHYGRTGCETTFQILHTRWRSRIRGYFFKRINDRTRADDLTQIVFMRVHNNRERYDPAKPFSVWIHAIAGNLTINEGRTESRRRVHTMTDLEGDPGVVQAVTEGHSMEVRPDDFTYRRQIRAQIERELGQMEAIFAEPFRLHELEGHPYEEISEALSVPVGTVKSRMHRARTQLRERLGHLRTELSAGGSARS